MIKAVIFDLGHTLMHFPGDLPAVERTGAEAMAAWLTRKNRLKMDADALATTFLAERKRDLSRAVETQEEVTAAETLRNTREIAGAPAGAKALITEAIRHYFTLEESTWTAFDDSVETLRALHKRRLRLGILSNVSDDALIQRLINQLYLRPWVSPTFSSAGLKWRKPRPEPFLLIAKRWELEPAEVVVVGDSLETDILGARNAAMKAVLVVRGGHRGDPPNMAIEPDAYIGRLAELPEVLVSRSFNTRGKVT